MRCEYYYNFNNMLFNVLYFKKPKKMIYSDVRGCFPQGAYVTFTIQIIG